MSHDNPDPIAEQLRLATEARKGEMRAILSPLFDKFFPDSETKYGFNKSMKIDAIIAEFESGARVLQDFDNYLARERKSLGDLLEDWIKADADNIIKKYRQVIEEFLKTMAN